MDKSFSAYMIEDRSYVAFVKREIHNQLLISKFSKSRIGEIDIIVSEITSNLIKHAKKGELLYRMHNTGDQSTFEIISIDNGPGMANVQRMMKDGVSTTNTLGHGLGAIQRLSNEFQIYSIPNWGTVLYCFITSTEKNTRRLKNDLEVKAICVPKQPEPVCGDGYGIKKSKDYIKVFLGDGLGHGQYAHEATTVAHACFINSEEMDPVEIIREMNECIKKTRGIVATVAVLDMKSRVWRICGVGNISARLYGGIMFKHYTSYNGIIGSNMPKSIKESVIEAEQNQQLIMCSDGIRSRWDLTKYPSILKYDLMLLAASLYKDFNRRTDDSSVFIGKVMLQV